MRGLACLFVVSLGPLAAQHAIEPDARPPWVIAGARAALADPDESVRQLAAERLAEWLLTASDRASSAKALGDALRTSQQPATRGRILDALARCGEDAAVARDAVLALATDARSDVPYAERRPMRLSGPAPSVRAAALRAIGAMGEKGARCLEALASLLGEEHPEATRVAAIEAMAMIGGAGAPVAARLVPFLQASSPQSVRMAATIALASIPSLAAQSAPLLAALLEDQDEDVRNIAIGAIVHLGDAAAPFAAKLLAAYERMEPDRWKYLAVAIAMKPASTATVMSLGSLLPKLPREQRNDLLLLLLVVDTVPPGLAEILDPLVRDWPVDELAVRLLSRCGPMTAGRAERFVALTRPGLANGDVRRAAVTALGSGGKLAAKHAPVLASLLEEGDDEQLQCAALGALLELDAVDLIPVRLLRLLVERGRVERTLFGADRPEILAAKLAPRVSEWAPLLAPDVAPDVHQATLTTLDRLGRHAAPLAAHAAALTTLDHSEDVRAAAIAALDSMGGAASPQAPALLAVLEKSSSERLRDKAASALAQIAPEKCVELLVPLLDKEPARHSAARALLRLGRRALPHMTRVLPLLREADARDKWAERSLPEPLASVAACVPEPSAADTVPFLFALAEIAKADGPLHPAAASRLVPSAGTDEENAAATVFAIYVACGAAPDTGLAIETFVRGRKASGRTLAESRRAAQFLLAARRTDSLAVVTERIDAAIAELAPAAEWTPPDAAVLEELRSVVGPDSRAGQALGKAVAKLR